MRDAHRDRAGGVAALRGKRVRAAVNAIGYQSGLSRLGVAIPGAAGNRVSYQRGGVVEWYRNGPLGLEQGFTFRNRPRAGKGWLTVSERLTGGLVARRVGAEVLLTRTWDGGAVLRYGALSAAAARGRSLPTRLELHGNEVSLQVPAGPEMMHGSEAPPLSRLTAEGGRRAKAVVGGDTRALRG